MKIKWIQSTNWAKLEADIRTVGIYHEHTRRVITSLQKLSFYFFIQNAVTLDTMFFSLNPQSIDSLEPIFQKYLKFSFVFFFK